MKLVDSQHWELARHTVKVRKLERAQGSWGSASKCPSVCHAPAALWVSLRNWSERPEQREAGAGAQLVAQSRPGGRDVPTAQTAFI